MSLVYLLKANTLGTLRLCVKHCVFLSKFLLKTMIRLATSGTIRAPLMKWSLHNRVCSFGQARSSYRTCGRARQSSLPPYSLTSTILIHIYWNTLAKQKLREIVNVFVKQVLFFSMVTFYHLNPGHQFLFCVRVIHGTCEWTLIRVNYCWHHKYKLINFSNFLKLTLLAICKRAEVVLNICYLSSSLPNFCMLYQIKSRWTVSRWGWRLAL